MRIYRDNGTISLDLAPSLNLNFAPIAALLRRYQDFAVILFCAITSFIGWRYYYIQNLTLSYNDSMSHLDIARRVFDNLTPGFAQIGSVWLPLPHLLSMLFVWNDFLWHSGLAGSIISGLAFIGSGFLVFRLVKLLLGDRLAAVLAMLIFALNPNMIYMQTSPMTESLLLFFFIAATYFLLKWQKTDDIKNLVISALFTFAGTLTRYDGWMLLLQMGLVVLVISARRGGYKKAESNVILFMTLAAYGIGLWLLWNKLIFGDYLYFATGPFSAKAQQLVFESEGRLFSKGNLLYSAFIYFLTIIRNNGALFVMLSGIGALLYFVRQKLSNEALVLSLLLSPLFFNISALYFGHSIINLPDLPPNTLFNVRYGLMMLPAVAVFSSLLAKRQVLITLLLVSFLGLQSYFMYRDNAIITVQDGISGASAQGMSETGAWLHKNAKEGLILIAASSQDSLIFQSKLPMKRFIHEGTGGFWKESLENPTRHAAYIAMHHGDLIYNKISTNSAFLENYEKVYDGEFTDIFRLSPMTKKPLTENDLP
jgi:hypothetical protein